MAVDCDLCGSETADPRACGDCGGVFCPDHESPFTHECPSLASVVAEDTFRRGAPRSSRSLVRAVGVWGAVALATVLSLAVVGAATGVFTPAAVVDTPPEPAPPPDTGPVTTPAPPDPDPAAIRTALAAALNDWRADAGHDRLDRAPERRAVLDRLAADLAREQYFEHPELRDQARFSPRHRLGERGFDCANYTRGFVVLTPEDDRRTAEAFGTDAAAMLRPELAGAVAYRHATVHAVGVHVTPAGVVYVAYVAC